VSKHIMIDIENLGLKPGSVITQIGAVVFDPTLPDGKMISKLNLKIDPQSCVAMGMKIDLSTLQWWAETDVELFATQIATGGYSIGSALYRLSELFQNHRPQHVWAKDPDFDCSHLAKAYELCDLSVPWRYHQTRSVRTLEAFWGTDAEIEYTGTKHDALSDALNQAESVIARLDKAGATYDH